MNQGNIPTQPEIQEQPKEILDLTKINQKEDTGISILPPALLAASKMNKRYKIGSIEVQLPVANYKILCNALASFDELSIKTISGSMHQYNDALLKSIYEACTFPKESAINTFEDFLYRLSEADFKVACYGVMRATYKKLESTNMICPNPDCPNPDEKKIFSFQPEINNINIVYPKAPFVSPSNDFTKDLFVFDDETIKICFKFDTIGERFQELSKFSNTEIRNNIMNIGAMIPKDKMLPFFVDSITIKDEDPTKNIILKDAMDISIFFKKLDTTTREFFENVNNTYIDHVLSWVPTFETEVNCPHCDHKVEWKGIDIFVEFFRKFSAIY